MVEIAPSFHGIDEDLFCSRCQEASGYCRCQPAPESTPTTVPSAGSAGSTGVTGYTGTPEPESGRVLDAVRGWLTRFVRTMHEHDLDLLTLWAAHSHLTAVLFTSPRLVLDSPVPGSGKTTCLEHLQRLCLDPVQMASLSSPALLTRMLAARPRTVRRESEHG
jgi:hypothetical protein